MKILFVDDDADFVTVLKHDFPEQGMEFVLTCGEALARTRAWKYDALVVDLSIDMDGATFIKLANGRLKDTRVFILSGLDTKSAESKIESIKDRVVGFYNKDQVHLLKRELFGEEVRK